MPKVNGKIYYNNVTGTVLLALEQSNTTWGREMTFAEDVATHPQLRGIAKDVIKLKKLEWDQYKSDFEISRPVQFKDGSFLWIPFDEQPTSQPQKPLSKRVDEIEKDSELTKLNMARNNAEMFETILMMFGG